MKLLCCAAVVTFLAAGSALEALPWWQTAVLYQVYPRSFKDSDGDGIGDLKGITQMADYFKEVGIDAIWLSPIYQSPMFDMGYDITNFTDVDSLFGTMQDFEDLAAKLKSLGVKLLMDLVPNHSSDQHPWFQSSLNQSDPHHSDYRDFYVWRNPSGWVNGTPLPPNNWISVFNGPAWTYREERKQFYLHQFKPQQPDLNYRDPNLCSNMTNVLSFWMDRGVDGFRVDAAKFVFENASFPDTPAVPGTNGDTYGNQQHIYTEDQPETLALVKFWADLVYQRSKKDGIQRGMWMEIYDPLPTLIRYYGTGNDSLEVPFNFIFMNVNQASRSLVYKSLIDVWMSSLPAGATTNWVIGNHDQMRVAERCGHEMVDSMNLLTSTLPGVKVTYYGEEIGMQNTYIRPDQIMDTSIYARDPGRSPMQWDDSVNAGFSTNPTTWLPVNPNYWWLNVAAQKAAETSHLKVFQAMTQARKDPVLQRGNTDIHAPDNDTLVIVRYYDDDFFVLIINMGSDFRTYTSQEFFIPYGLDLDMKVVVGSVNSGYAPGLKVQKGLIRVSLRPKASVLLRTSDSTPSSSSTAHAASMAWLLVTLALYTTATL